MSQTATLAGLAPALLFLKATRKKRVFVPTFTRRDGTVVLGHYAEVNVADDHNDHEVLAGRGSHSQRQAHAKLSQHDWFNEMPHDHRVNLLLHHATKIQDKASRAAAISGWRSAALNNRNPSASQWRAFYTLSNERKAALLDEVERNGRGTSHLNAPPMPASEAAIARATAAEHTPATPAHPVPRPAETLGSVGLSARTVETGGHLVLADDAGSPRVFYHGGPATLGGGRLNDGTFFAINRADADEYARQHSGGRVHEANLSLLKPASKEDIVAAARAVGVDFSRVEAMDPRHPEDNAWSLLTDGHTHDAPRVVAKLKEWGFDGAAFDNDFTASGNGHINSVMVFNADQIVPAQAARAAPRVVAASASSAPTEPVTVVPATPASGSRSIPAAPDGGADNGTPREGDTKTVDGVSYVLRDGRWHRQSEEPGSVGTALIGGVQFSAVRVNEGRGAAWAVRVDDTGQILPQHYSRREDAWTDLRRAAHAMGDRFPQQFEAAAAAPVVPDAATAPAPSSADHERHAAAMRAVPAPIFPATSESNAGCTRRVAQLQAFAAVGDVDAITNFATSRTRSNYSRVADYRDALLAAAQNLTPAEAQAAVSAPPPAPPQLTGTNMQNTALLAAQRKVNMLADAARAADPVAAIQAIGTSRGNRYLNAADDYKRALLAHFGVDVSGTPVPGVSAEGPAPRAPRAPRVTAAREAEAPVAPAVAVPAGEPEVVRYSDRNYRRGGSTGWQFQTPQGAWHDMQDRSMRARLDRGVDPVHRGGTRAEVNAPAASPAAPVPDSQNPAIAANPLGLSEEVLGFVPRPNVPLDVRTNQPGVRWPDPRMAELNRRYLAQSTTLQSRAREYQAGTYRPRTPEQAAAEAAAAAERQRAEQEAIRRAAAKVEARIGSIDALFRPRATVGANIRSMSFHNSDAEVQSVLGVSKQQAEKLFKSMVADYGAGVTFVASASVSGNEASVTYAGSDGTSITRRFTKNTNGLTVYHAYFKAGTTGGGSGKHLFRTSMGVYKALGVTEVGVTANIDVGGYAWARFGYLPRDWRGLRANLQARLENLRRGRRDPGADIAEKITRVLQSDSPEALWAIADMRVGERQIGKELLLGTHWGGVMKLSHKPTMLRFAQYVKPQREG
jgi:hypothetical protein